ncbi:MAG: hypothetical protein CVV33_08890 [Methanomicrobiales archaeon HGW-Methanomicrobiales-4]|nr:MAG: hypothetical protein CVV33_08890 [Methanomicrobiales archaeon HGW-Methanomicrobiales-4]
MQMALEIYTLFARGDTSFFVVVPDADTDTTEFRGISERLLDSSHSFTIIGAHYYMDTDIT